MGFTIEDMMTKSGSDYKMKLVAGKNGWSNSIKWIFLVEHTTILEHFSGKEMAVTTGLGFQSEDQLSDLADRCYHKHCSALMLNLGPYIKEVPESLITKCDEIGLPLLTIPWEVSISDMIKVLTLSIFQADRADEQVAQALIKAIEKPEARDLYEDQLLSYFDVDGIFQAALISTGSLATMDTVDRGRLSYRLQIYLENITHNGNFFYYDSFFVLVMNDVSVRESNDILKGFVKNCRKRIPDEKIYVGVGSRVHDIQNLRFSVKRAKCAIDLAFTHEKNLVYFDDMGINRLLYSIPEKALVKEMGEDLLAPLIAYDQKKGTDYVQTLKLFLEYNGSIQAVAKEMFAHRNTVIYHLNNIKKLLDSDLSDPEDRLTYLIACLIYTR